MTMRFSLLDQSQLSAGSTAEQAFADTLTMARLADTLGFERIWFSEHHSLPILQGSVPELMVAAAARDTSRIRVGTGGIMLANHTAFHVAEVFRSLETLAPGRIDAGIGRAGGGFPQQYAPRRVTQGDDFEAATGSLLRLLQDAEHGAIAMPQPATRPPVWVLSGAAHPRSGDFAASRGLGLAVAAFINPHVDASAVARYRSSFTPSEEFPEPRVILALSCVCAEDPDRLAQLKKTTDYFRLRRDTGHYLTAVPSPEAMESVRFSGQDEAYLRSIDGRQIVGTPQEVVTQAHERAAQLQADEVMLTFMTYALEDRLDAVRAIAEVAGLPHGS